MPELQSVTIRIGKYGVATTPAAAAKIIADPAQVLRLWSMMEEAAQRLGAAGLEPVGHNRLRHD